MSRPNDASRNQIAAADPTVSVWVTANAGAGKTKVLTDRVARLLLAGTPPARILCLTYTKAAAAEMQLRLFERLGAWAMLDDAALSRQLADMGLDPGGIDADARRRARRLFARALETPGGLKIQTIHSFCATLLRRFPLEAGVPHAFTELDDRAARLMRDALLDDLAEAEPARFDALAAHLPGDDLGPLLGEILRDRATLNPPPPPGAIFAALGLPEGFSEPALLDEVFLGGEAALLADLLPALRNGSTNDQKAADRLAALDLSAPGIDTLAGLEPVFLYGKGAKAPFGAKIGDFPTKPTRAAETGWLAPLEALMARVEAARPRRQAVAAAERTLALHRFAETFLAAWEARKQAHAVLDFDDLIGRARLLLEDSSAAQWVLWKLDGGIDHILVDEAQDTSPAQWRLIQRLTEEFTAGGQGRARSVFVVGDEKQSIYSFQGADPEAFGQMHDIFARRLAGGPAPLVRLPLHYSFRSARAVLRAVDATFAGGGAAAGLGGTPPEHRAFKTRMAGRVDLWPAIAAEDKTEPPPWDAPLDAPAPGDPALLLAATLADEVARMLAEGTQIETESPDGLARRALTPGDVLILVQRRSALFHEIIRALKARGLPVAGADRLRIGGELAVRDLTALLSFLATPEDDLSLAAVLRSPVFGWSEDALFRLAHGREGRLWAALRAATDPLAAGTRAVLSDLLAQVDFLRPYELLERALTRHGARLRLIARLGAEAEEGIDALLWQALTFERGEVPGLTGFLGWLAAAEVEIKRQLDSAGDRIRVMSVHGAKGLQAPVVILPDTAERRPGRARALLPVGERELPVWGGKADELPAPAAAARARLAEAEEAERLRLLYVAMTRAENWLIVCAAGKTGERSWHARVAAGLEAAGARTCETPTGAGLRLDSGAWPEPAVPSADTGPREPAPLPAWALAPAPAAPRPPEPLSPSDLGGAKTLPGEPDAAGGQEQAAALAHGSRVHLALELLPGQPPAARRAMLERTLRHGALAPPPAERDACIARVLDDAARVLDATEFAPLFAPGTLAEAGIAAPLPLPRGGTRPLRGAIDRLVIGPERVLAVDFKTNALVPDRPEDVPEGYLRQMGAYRAALAALWPRRTVEVALLWTRAPRLMLLPHDLVTGALDRALAAVAHLDRGAGAP